MVRFYFLALFIIQIQTFGQEADSTSQQVAEVEEIKRVTELNKLSQQYFSNDQLRALTYAEEALKLARRVGDKGGESVSLNNIGVIRKNQGRLDLALSSYMKSLAIENKYDLQNRVASTYSNIGTIFSLQKDYIKALQYFTKALDSFSDQGRTKEMIGALNNVGNVYYEQGYLDSAIVYYQQSISIYEDLKDTRGVFVPYGNIGNIYFAEGNSHLALSYFQRALELEKSNKDLDGQANVLHSIGVVHKDRRDTNLAGEYFNDALALVQETGNQRLLSMIYQSLAETYFIKGDMFLAYSFLKLHSTAKDSLYNEENSRRIAELENRFELESKENELRELRSRNEIQSLRIQNDKIFIISIAVISIMGLVFTVIVVKELKQIKKNKKLLEIKNDKLEEQKLIIQQKNESITESIDYARSVQSSMLQFQVSEGKENKFFTVFKPKDIVSGDFFWYSEREDIDIIAAVDCTGHGVAGAFMTIIGSSCLEKIINQTEVFSPAIILEQLCAEVSRAMKRQLNGRSDHGMDVALAIIDYNKDQILFSGANRPLYLFNDKELIEIKGTRRGIGSHQNMSDKFQEHTIPIRQNTSFYLTTDGYADQFGGPKNKKFMTRKLKEKLTSVQSMTLKEQKEDLESTFTNWKGHQEQTDDVLIIGVRP